MSNFLEHFQLSAQEQAALKHQHFDREFFMALSRLQKIHNDCKVLLRTQHQKAGYAAYLAARCRPRGLRY